MEKEIFKINPKIDFAFKKIFGSNRRKNILISFLKGRLQDRIVIAKNCYLMECQ